MKVLELIKEGLENGKRYVIVGIEYVTIGRGEWPEALWAATITPEEKKLWPMWTIENRLFGREHHVKFYELDSAMNVHLEETAGMNTNVRVYRYNKETEREETISVTERYAINDNGEFYKYLKDAELIYNIHHM